MLTCNASIIYLHSLLSRCKRTCFYCFDQYCQNIVLNGNLNIWCKCLRPGRRPPWWLTVSGMVTNSHSDHISLAFYCAVRNILQVDPSVLTHQGREKWLWYGRRYIKCIFLNENFWISNYISLKCILHCLIDNMSSLVQIMACHRIGDKPLSRPMMVQSTDAYMCHLASIS